MGKRRGHGEGSIYQREDGLWCASVDLGRTNGKRRRKTIYGKTRKEVADKLKAIHRDLAAGLHIAAEQLTIEEFLNRWLREVICHRRPRTQESYEGTVRLHIVPQIGAHKLQKLSPEHVQSMLNSLSAKKVSPDGTETLAPRTVEYACLVLSRALNQAVKWAIYRATSRSLLRRRVYPSRRFRRSMNDKRECSWKQYVGTGTKRFIE
jgi:Phage integrase, N-terminal SAM-like domain